MNKWFYYLSYGHKLAKFKDIHKGQRCFIIGNAPSILQQDLTKLKNEIVFVVNKFVLHTQYKEISPAYYCIADPKAFTDSEQNITFHKTIMDKAKTAIKFLPISARSFIERNAFSPEHLVYYLNMPLSKTVWIKGSFKWDIAKIIYTAPTVIVAFCLPLALYMGCSKIYLLGCDCDYYGLGEKGHFYGDDGWRPPNGDYGEWYSQFYRDVIKSYSIVNACVSRCNAKIYNAGIGGKLEVFKRVNYDRLFIKGYRSLLVDKEIKS